MKESADRSIDLLNAAAEVGDGGSMMRTMQQKLVSVGKGRAVIEGTPGEQFNNYQGRIHGGYLAALIDTAMGWAVASKVPAKSGFGTVDLSVKYVRKFEVSSGPLLATATVLHAGRSMFTAECKVADGNGLLYAHGLGTFLVYPK